MWIMIYALMASSGEADSVSYSMILPGLVYGDVLESADEWMGLFIVDCGHWMLRPVNLECIPEAPPLYEDERPAGTIVILPDESESPLILVSSSPEVFSPGPVPALTESRIQLPADTSLCLASPEIEESSLSTTEEGLFLAAGGMTQRVTGTFPGTGPQSPFLSLVWAGDMDGDGRLDLLLDDVDNDYLIFSWDLYLSGEAGPGELVKKVASFYDVYY
ncbi:MAG: hypothetical protein JXA64_08655 [Candidatus Fermentibacteraceae bacterium]|nr:hypothetical protein [Candidatus Fermentibacteraceae bacterium]MBN2609171.1 hypothetical protein [Candidatus Fermentibacteraceae bacterium]